MNQTDLNVRLQLTGCKYGELINSYITDLKYGRKCKSTDLHDLMLLNAYIELMECYKLKPADIVSTGSINVTYFNKGTGLSVTVGEVNISSGVTVGANNANEFSATLVDDINSFQDIYIATLDTSGELYVINITGPCDAGSLNALQTGGGPIDFTISGMAGGVCGIEYNNCITEDELQTMIDNISTLTNICFQPEGFTYL